MVTLVVHIFISHPFCISQQHRYCSLVGVSFNGLDGAIIKEGPEHWSCGPVMWTFVQLEFAITFIAHQYVPPFYDLHPVVLIFYV